MADVRELTFGLDYDLDEPIKQLDAVVDRLEQVTSSEEDAADASHEVGAQLSSGMDAAEASTRRAEKAVEGIGTQLSAGADAAEDFGRAGEKIGSQFRDMGREADSFSSAVKKSMGTSLKSGKSFWSSIKAGAQGGFGYAEKRLSDWHKKFQTGAKSMAAALSHPIQTIKNKLGDALLSSEKRTEGLGSRAVEAAKKLLGMGLDGEEAGDSIKEAMKGAVSSLIGFEAIKGVISKLKELGAAALEVAKAAETTEKKFDAAFSGTDAAEWVDNFADAVHRSNAEVQSFMVSNKSMYGELGVTGQAAADLSKITTSLSYDFGNAFSMDDAEALGVIQDYIKGNNAALEEYGVHIDDATLKASAMQMGLGANVDSLNDAAKAQVRLNALLGQSESIQKAAINDTDGLANSQKSLNGIMQNFALEAGQEFAPVLEGLYGTIIDNWPTIEPMLMGLVETLSDGLSQATPVLLELGQTLIPMLTDVVGTLLQAATPVISVVSELAGHFLPPLVRLLGDIAETLLPPAVQLLESISPLLESLRPVLSFIGNALKAISEFLGKVIGWLADGVGKVTSFFDGIFGGAKDSKSAVDDLSGAVNGLGTATSKKTSLSVDTSKYKEKVEGAASASTKAMKSSSKQAQTSAEDSFSAMGASATSTYSSMEAASKSSWKSMTLEATSGANKIVSELNRVKTTAVSVSGAGTVSAAGAASTARKTGTSIPHHAGGTPHFAGGPTWMNEQGGELAVLPGGSAIIPADQTERLMQSYSNSISNTNNSTSNRTVITMNPEFKIVVQGDAGNEQTLSNLEARLRSIFRELYQEAQEEDYTKRALQAGFA